MQLPTPALLVACLVLPSLVFLALDRGLRAFTGAAPLRRRTGTIEVVPPRRPIERLAADLHRLDAELKVLQGVETYARHHHRESTQLAYDDVLRDCARALEVSAPPAPLTNRTRQQLEIELGRAGLRW